MRRALAGTGKTFLFTGGTGLISERTDGDWSEHSFAEDDAFVPRRQIAPRLETERTVRAASDRGLRTMCLRPPLIWGNHAIKPIADMYPSARETGAVCYVGRGLNCYSSVHVEDLADLYLLALEKGVPGALYHSASGELNWRMIAETIAAELGVPTRSITFEEAAALWDRFTALIVFGSCSCSRSPVRAPNSAGRRAPTASICSPNAAIRASGTAANAGCRPGYGHQGLQPAADDPGGTYASARIVIPEPSGLSAGVIAISPDWIRLPSSASTVTGSSASIS